jgi:23S rRNA-/tRNA-specific pseudouridylate synthase
MRVDKNGKPAETRFAVEKHGKNCSLVRATPITGRTHQIRIHLFDSGLRIIGDALYGSLKKSPAPEFPFALRSASLEYPDVFSKRSVLIEAPMEQFFASFGF